MTVSVPVPRLPSQCDQPRPPYRQIDRSAERRARPARKNGNPLVYDLHLLHALLAQEESIVVPILQKLGVNVAQLREGVERDIGPVPETVGRAAQPVARDEPRHRPGRGRGPHVG